MNNDDPIYLDFNATTPVEPEVIEAMLPYLRTHFGNPSSGHVYGRRAHEAVDRAREHIAALIGAQASEIIFTASGSEADNLVILGVADALDHKGRVAYSAIEHPAVAKPCRHLSRLGWSVTSLAVDAGGRVDLSAARQSLADGAALVTVMHSNNEVGTLQPVQELSDLAHTCGAVMHTDAAQSIGKMAINVDDLGVDALTIVGHKFYAPKGIGALYVRKGTPLTPIMFGGGQEGGLRSGTENVALIVALGAACDIARRRLAEDETRLRALRDRLWSRLQAGVPKILLNGDAERRLPHTLNVSFPHVRGSAVLAAAPAIAASTGSACHEGEETPSAVLQAMGFDRERALAAVRLSVGRTTTEAEIDAAAAALIGAWHKLSALAR